MIRLEGIHLAAGAFTLTDIDLAIPAGSYAVSRGIKKNGD